jgi:hypothetical protein
VELTGTSALFLKYSRSITQLYQMDDRTSAMEALSIL